MPLVRPSEPFPRPSDRTRSLVATTAALVVLLVAGLVLPVAAAKDDPAAVQVPVRFALPAPTGAAALGTLDLHLVDDRRDDPWRPGTGPRELMVSIWYPADPDPDVPATPYLPAAVARFYDRTSQATGIERGEVDFAGVTSHAQTRVPVAPALGPRPVIIYSPGGGLPRAMGTTLVEELVSHGYVVVTVDSTYQAPVEFPDRTVMPARGVDLSQALAERVQDLRFALDQLAVIGAGGNPDAQRRTLPSGPAAALDLAKVGAFGHSLGGFAAAELMTLDDRVDVGANLDGSMDPDLGSAAIVGVDRPFLLMGAGRDGDRTAPHDHVGAPDLAAFWAASSGWKRDVHLPRGEHLSFCDQQVRSPQLARPLSLDPELIAAALGTIDPDRSLAIQRAYLLALFDLHLLGRPTTVFDEESAVSPDARLVP